MKGWWWDDQMEVKPPLKKVRVEAKKVTCIRINLLQSVRRSTKYSINEITAPLKL